MLEDINNPSDIKKLDINQLQFLADEIQEFLIENIIKNRTALYILENVLNRILREEIREKQNLVYSISAYMPQMHYFPTQTYSFYIIFNSDPKNNDLILLVRFHHFNSFELQIKPHNYFIKITQLLH